jgi:hypothetical protein
MHLLVFHSPLLVTLCIVIIRCTETFNHPVFGDARRTAGRFKRMAAPDRVRFGRDLNLGGASCQ